MENESLGNTRPSIGRFKIITVSFYVPNNKKCRVVEGMGHVNQTR